MKLKTMLWSDENNDDDDDLFNEEEKAALAQIQFAYQK
jgi:hypothetical protein